MYVMPLAALQNCLYAVVKKILNAYERRIEFSGFCVVKGKS